MKMKLSPLERSQSTWLKAGLSCWSANQWPNGWRREFSYLEVAGAFCFVNLEEFNARDIEFNKQRRRVG